VLRILMEADVEGGTARPARAPSTNGSTVATVSRPQSLS
jgi:hypothetical protein